MARVPVDQLTRFQTQILEELEDREDFKVIGWDFQECGPIVRIDDGTVHVVKRRGRQSLKTHNISRAAEASAATRGSRQG